MNKEQFLKQLRSSLKKYSVEEVDKAVGYYDEIISDKIEQGYDERGVIAGLGDIKNISKEIQLDILNVRTFEPSKSNLRRSTSSAWVALMLLASPALLPIAIALFTVFFTVLVTSAALMISFFVTGAALIISLIPAIVYTATFGAGEALLTAAAILLCAAVFGFLTIVFYYLTKMIMTAITKLAMKLAKKDKKGDKK
ncbi:MAG: DUF1700 domain-containing protein [Clostridia bacterium]|nr:DUF1700 domain-containing protein [Clostridia bacterium]